VRRRESMLELVGVHRLGLRRSLTAAPLLAALLWLPACAERNEAVPEAAHDVVVAPIEVAEGDGEVSFRFIDPATGAVATAVGVESIPESARSQVVVYHGLHPTPPGWEHVADLSSGLPVTTVPRRGFSLQTRRVAGETRKATARRKVTLFSTTWCGYCRKARAFFQREKVMFSEYDLEKDSGARAKMALLAKDAGVAPESLKGVPIIFINGQAMSGYNEARVRQLLGR
jgi:glutaredoxin